MKTKISFILFSFISILFFTPSKVTAEDDWQYWNLMQIQSKVSEDITWRIFSEQWLSEDFNHFFLTNVDTGLTWKSNRYWSLGFFYRRQMVYPEDKNSVAENRYYPEMTFYLPMNQWVLSNRTRSEYHDTGRKDFWIFRDRLQVSYHANIHEKTFTPYLYNEVFYHTIVGNVNENRAGLGLSFQLCKNISLSVYYQIRNFRQRADWQSAQVIGTIWTLKI